MKWPLTVSVITFFISICIFSIAKWQELKYFHKTEGTIRSYFTAKYGSERRKSALKVPLIDYVVDGKNYIHFKSNEILLFTPSEGSKVTILYKKTILILAISIH